MTGDTNTISPEQRLFVGVITNAAQEAAGAQRTRGNHLTIQESARAWFRNNGTDFRMVCDLAGLEPCEVRARVLAYVDRVDEDPEAFVRIKRANMPSRDYGVSIPDVAREAGVSAATVSNVIHGRRVGPAMHARVQAAIDKLERIPISPDHSRRS